MTAPVGWLPTALPPALAVTPSDLMVVGLLALAAFGVPGIAALAWLKLRGGDDSDAE